jgi:phospholipid-binding lipoprotein MlaA
MKGKIVSFCMACLLAVAGSAAAEEKGFSEPPDLLDESYFAEDYDDFGVEGNSQLVIHDPLEPLNRLSFTFNDKLYFWVIQPIETGYSYAVPVEFRQSFSNFFRNLAAPVRFANTLLQGRFEDAGVVLSRFLINSTAGVYGFVDAAAREWDIAPQSADLAQTLGVYGVGEGIYLCWPVFGPSNIRHSLGIAGDVFAGTTYYIDMTYAETVAYYSINRVNLLSLSAQRYEDLKRYSIDPYVSLRQAFYDYRRNIVENNRSEDTARW